MIKHFRDCVKGAPRELYANVLLTAGPVGKDSLMVVQMCYVGSREKGQEYLAAILSWDGERCLLNEVDEKSFLHQQDSVAQVLRGKGIVFIIISFCGLRNRADPRPFLFSPSHLLFSGSSMVHPFRSHIFFAGRYY